MPHQLQSLNGWKMSLVVILRLLLTLVTLSLLVTLVWSLVFDVTKLSLWLMGALAATVPLFALSRWALAVRIALALILSLCLPDAVSDLNARIAQLADKHYRHLSPDAFSTREKFGIWGLNFYQGLLGAVVYPEAATETLLLALPSPVGGVREWDSEFPLGSKRVQQQLKSITAELTRRPGTHVREYGPRPISWNSRHYVLGDSESRYALALNDAQLWVSAKPLETTWELTVTVECSIAYPCSSRICLLQEPRLEIEEGLYWLLQECDMLHPYIARYRFVVLSSDHRIRGNY
jgi:hypothetical protein